MFLTGDEVAVKPGRDGFVYGGPDMPMTNLVLIAAGVGVVPMIQMVNELLPSSSSRTSVASASGEEKKVQYDQQHFRVMYV